MDAVSSPVKFAHRRNADGSIDSICLKCYRTVASRRAEEELDAPQAAHVCSGFDLAHLPHQAEPRNSR
jgi:hypothetical protein